MSDEIKVTTEEKESKCFCQSKGFRKFLTIALGTFVGVYFALCLFAALHKPPMIPAFGSFDGGMKGCPCKMIHHHHIKHDNFNRGAMPNANRPAPFEAQRNAEN